MRARRQRRKAQSAIEYLTTYGWAVLIIAVVLGLFFLIGVFNLNFFTPRAAPGSCSVYRPQGPGTNFQLALTGVCTSEIPEYVTNFKNDNNYMNVGSFSSHIINRPMTYSIWVYVIPPVPISNWQDFGGMSNGVDGAFYIAGAPNANNFGCVFQNSLGTLYTAGPQVPLVPYKWHHLVAAYDGSMLRCYMDGKQVESVAASGYITNTMVDFTVGYIDGIIRQYLQGSVADVQFYNTSLSASDVKALYVAGIGGAPLDLQHIVGWWPMNGDLNDYSGNGYNGNFFGNTGVVGLSYITNWQNGYSNS